MSAERFNVAVTHLERKIAFNVETKYQDAADATIADYFVTAEGYDFVINPGTDEENQVRHLSERKN